MLHASPKGRKQKHGQGEKKEKHDATLHIDGMSMQRIGSTAIARNEQSRECQVNEWTLVCVSYNAYVRLVEAEEER